MFRIEYIGKIATISLLCLCASSALAATVKVFDSAVQSFTSVDYRFASNMLQLNGYERAGVFTLEESQTINAFNILAKPVFDVGQFPAEVLPLTVSFFDNNGNSPATSPFASSQAMSVRFDPESVSGENTFRVSGSFAEIGLPAGSFLFLLTAESRNFELIGISTPAGSGEFGRASPGDPWEPYAFGPATLDFELFAGVVSMPTLPLPGGVGLLLCAIATLYCVHLRSQYARKLR